MADSLVPSPFCHVQSRMSGRSSPLGGDVALVLGKFVADDVMRVGPAGRQLRHAVEHVGHQMKPIQIVQDGHIERRRGRAFFLLPPDMEIMMICPAVGQAWINQE